MKNDDLYETKDKLNEMRKTKQETDELFNGIQNLRTVCYAMREHIKYEGEKIKALRSEILYRQGNLNDTIKLYESITDQKKDNSNSVEKFKESLIKKKLESILYDYIPEIDPNFQIMENDLDYEFHNLIFDNIIILYTNYNDTNMVKTKELKQTFRISKRTTFKYLKISACNYWDLDNYTDFAITDDAECLIYNEEVSVDNYFKDYSPNNNLLRLLSLNTIKKRKKIIPIQEIRIKEGNRLNIKERKKKKLNYEFNSSDLSGHKINSFINEYPGIKSYLLKSNEEDEKDDDDVGDEDTDKKIEILDYESSFSLLMLLFMFILTTFIFLFYSRDVSSENYKRDQMNELFNHKNVSDYKSLFLYFVNLGVYFKRNVSDLDAQKNTSDCYLCNDLLRINILNDTFQDEKIWKINKINKNLKLYTNNTLNYIKQKRESIHFEFASSIRLIINRVKNKKCNNSTSVHEIISNVEYCFSEFYTSDNVETDGKIYFEFNNNYTNYSTASKGDISFTINTLTGQYNGDGYHYDIKGNDNFSIFKYIGFLFDKVPLKSNHFTTRNNSEDKNIPLDNLLFADDNVRQITILFNIYYSKENTWMNSIISFDILTSGAILPSALKFNIFKIDLYSDPKIIIIDLIRFILIFFLSTIIIKEIRSKLMNGYKWFQVIHTKNIISLFIIIIFLVAFFLRIKYLNHTSDNYIVKNADSYLDLYGKSQMFSNVYLIETILFSLIISKTLAFFTLNRSARLYFTTLNLYGNIFFKYMIFIIGFLIIYTSCAHIIWGPYLDNFNEFSSSFVQILLFTIGYFNAFDLINADDSWALIFVLTLYLIMFCLMYTTFMAFFAEGLRKAAVESGYPEDNDFLNWNYKDYINWILNKSKKIKK